MLHGDIRWMSAMPYSHPQPISPKDAFSKVRHLVPGAMALAFMAGFVNSSALAIFHSPVSHMSGTVSHLGIDLAGGRWSDALASVAIVCGFVVGALLAGMMVGAWKLVPGRAYGVVMVVEGVVLGVAGAVLMAGYSRLGVPMVALACGLQNAMSSSYCGLMIRTTHVTGTVTDIGVILGHWLRHRQIQGYKLAFLSGLVLSFGVGGWAGALAESRLGPKTLFGPAVLMMVAGAVFWFLHHTGVVDLMQNAAPRPPQTGSIPDRQ
jgi:uncharacterized membrane protein YoaK (UPF0700 family)